MPATARSGEEKSRPTFCRARYIRAIEDLGGVPLILPLASDRAVRRHVLQGLQGLLLTGSGPDLPPHLYGNAGNTNSGL